MEVVTFIYSFSWTGGAAAVDSSLLLGLITIHVFSSLTVFIGRDSLALLTNSTESVLLVACANLGFYLILLPPSVA